MGVLKDLKNRHKAYGFKIIAFYLYLECKHHFLNCFLRNSYSQLGEDLFIDKYLNYEKRGYYVDIGAGDPDRFNNTKRFYLRGWTGINIEPHPDSYQKLCRSRPRDFNLNIGVGRRRGKFPLYLFLPAALSTFCQEDKNWIQRQGYQCTGQIEIPVFRLGEVLKKYCRREIDFLSLDVEGLEFEVLKSNCWSEFRPRVICLESGKHVFLSSKEAPVPKENNKAIELYLRRFGYRKYFSNVVNTIFVRSIVLKKKDKN